MATRTAFAVGSGRLWGSPALIDGLLAYAVAMAVGVAVFTSSVGSQPWPAYVFALGFGLILLIRRRYPVLVLIITSLGICVYYTLQYPPIGLAEAIRVVAAGDALLSASVTRKVMEGIVSGPAGVADRGRLNELTEREREVLAGVGRGLSNDEIAAEIHISPATARTYVSRMMTKLGARNRAQLVVIAYESGLVTPGRALETPDRP
jgi:DNA-binding CsgD family transcriptional regulator